MSAVESKSRIDLLKMGKDAIKALTLPMKVRKDKKNLEIWIIDKESEIAEKELIVQEAKSAEEFDADKILDAIDDLELLQRRLKQGKELMKELFNEVE